MTNADGGAQTRWYSGPGGFFLAACLLLSVLPSAFTLAYRLLKGPLERLDMENRLAQRMPVPRRESLLDGSFQRGFERCLADQLPKRTSAVMLWRRSEQALASVAYGALYPTPLRAIDGRGHWDNSGQILRYAGQPVRQTVPDLERANRVLAGLVARYPDIRFHLHRVQAPQETPFVAAATGHALPALSPAEWARWIPAGVSRSETAGSSLAELQSIFYRSDHHWRPEAAYAAYAAVARALGIADIAERGPLQGIDGARFTGSLARQCANPAGFDDAVEYLLPPKRDVTVLINGREDARSDLDRFLEGHPIKPAALSSYSALFGGDVALVSYLSPGAPDRRLLLIADSMSQSMERWFALHFRQTEVVDTRHWLRTYGREFNLEEFMKERASTHVVWLGLTGTILAGLPER
jgi:hypothetical protein